MSLEEREGVLDRVTEKGILLSGDRLSYSKWFEGDRPTEDLLGCKIRVVVDVGEKCSFVRKLLRVDGKVSGWKPPVNSDKGSFGSGGRRLSPEELELKVQEGRRIARCCAAERAVEMVRQGVTVHEIASQARLLEEYFTTGKLPIDATMPTSESPVKPTPVPPKSLSLAKPVPSANPQSSPTPGPEKPAAPPPSKPKRLAAKVVSGLFNEALRGGLVDDWQDFLAEIERVLKVQIKNPYQLDSSAFSKVESVIRSKLGQSSAA
jgi:hypothetical protein